jgi:hypothetical protein
LINITGTNNYNQWMYINNAWSNIGSTSVDLTNYYTKTQTDTLLDDKVDKVTGYGLSQENFTSAYKDQLDNYTVDTILNSTSSNPIANSAVTNGLDAKQNKTLTTSLVIDGTTTTTVEAALGNLNTYANKKLTITSTIPASPSNGDVILYTGTSTADYKQGGIYQYQVSEWVIISSNSDPVKKHNYSMVGTASLEDDIKTFVTALIALGANTYAGYFNRSGNLGTAGNYCITVYAEEGTSTFATGYIVLGAGALGKTQYMVSYYKPTGSSEDWVIKKLATKDSSLQTPQLSGSVDCNALTESGLYTASAGAVSSLANAPVNAQVQLDGGFSILVTKTNVGGVHYGMQMFIPYGSDLPFMRKAYYLNGQSWTSWEQLATKSDLPTSGVGSGINKQDIVSGDANTPIDIPAYHFCSGLMYLQISGIGTALLSYDIDFDRNLTLKVIAGTGISLTGLTLYKGQTPLGTFSANGDYIVFSAQYYTIIRTNYASL